MITFEQVQAAAQAKGYSYSEDTLASEEVVLCSARSDECSMCIAFDVSEAEAGEQRCRARILEGLDECPPVLS